MKNKFLKGRDFFDKVILEHPLITIFVFLAFILFFSYHARDFRIDASSETLLNENNKELEYYRTISKRYESKDFIVITYKPYSNNLFSRNVLNDIGKLRNELKKLKRVESVVTILDVPLIETAHSMNIKDLTKKIPTLESSDIDINLAKKEFKNSPLYRNLLVSPQLDATALQVIMKPNKRYIKLLNKRSELAKKMKKGVASEKDKAEYKKLKIAIRNCVDSINDLRHKDISKIRSIVKKYSDNAKLILGGVPLIADDLILFIKNDLKVFGVGVFIFMLFTLIISFGKIRWVILPMLCCAFAVVVMMGILGIFDWEVTVISSNFISLQLILTLSIAIHLIVRYEEFHSEDPTIPNRPLIKNTIEDKFLPCLYTTLTTIAGFSSLLLCELKPVRTFGWMMSVGLLVSLLLTFIFFPAQVMLLKKASPLKKKKVRFPLIAVLTRFVKGNEKKIIALSSVVIVLSVIGISTLKVENSFIDYFKHSTEIYRGLKFIDQKLGGTTPFDVILKFKEEAVEKEMRTQDNDDDLFEEFDNTEHNKPEYWFTNSKVDLIKKVHDYLNSLPHIGKVLSLKTLLKVVEKINNGKPLDNFELALLYKELPKKTKDMILKPYVSIEHNEAHIVARVKDSDKNLRRNELLNKIKYDFTHKLGLTKDMFNITGILVLYNNILQSLFKSQILTLGFTILLLMLMFLILFRSLKISLIAIFPNVLPVLFVLGFMGWANIHLDMMTITIAAITMGIAVDDTIHYIHRFEQEFNRSGNYLQAMFKCGETIAYAMFYTSLVITVGFSILVFSNFIPTIYFGLLTGLAMIVALIANITLLPALIIIFKPYGKEK
jgi:predicted RND superfamily exporter protein